MAQIQGTDVTLQLRENGTTGAYLNVVCETNSDMKGSASVKTEVTKCSTLTSVSAPVINFSVDGIAETAPTADQVSIETLLTWFVNNTLLDVKYENPEGAGTDYHLQGTCYMTDFGITSPAEGSVGFSASFQMTGTIDTTP